MNALPEDAIFHVLQYLHGDEVLVASAVSTTFRRLCAQSNLWTTLSLIKFTIQGREDWATILEDFADFESKVQSKRCDKRKSTDEPSPSFSRAVLPKPKLPGTKADPKLYDVPIWKRFYFERPFRFERRLNPLMSYYTFKLHALESGSKKDQIQVLSRTMILVQDKNPATCPSSLVSSLAPSSFSTDSASASSSSSSSSRSSSTPELSSSPDHPSQFVVILGYDLAGFHVAVDWVQGILSEDFVPSTQDIVDQFVEGITELFVRAAARTAPTHSGHS